MLTNLPIQNKLMLMLAGPLLVLLVVSGLSIRKDLNASSAASDAERRTEMSMVNGMLSDAIRQEAVQNQISISDANVDFQSFEAVTDTQLASWQELASGYEDLDTEGLAETLGSFEAYRRTVRSQGSAGMHQRDIELLGEIARFDARVAAEATGDAAVEIGRSASLTSVHLVATDAQLLGLWATTEGAVPTPASSALATQLDAAETLIEQWNVTLDTDRQVASPTSSYNQLSAMFSERIPGQLLAADATTEAWLNASNRRSDAIAAAHAKTWSNSTAQAQVAADDARGTLRSTGFLNLIGILGGLGLALLIGTRMRKDVDQLNVEAAAVAQHDLPELANSLRSGDPVSSETNRPYIEVTGTDEFSELQRSLNKIRESADEVGKEQAETLQSGIADMFVNMARRNQTLVDRQLQVIDELEAEERDPDRLGQMYRVDHLATRMRRNAESLLVLAGHTQTRRRGAPVDLREVVRVAIGEVEDYRRIIPIALDDIPVAGHVAQDLAHLLSELMENATQSSPPGTVADVLGIADADGSYSLQVIDRGTGLDEEQLEALNLLLQKPPTNSLEMSRSMGLTVVGRLAKRIGVSVHLGRGAETGTIAQVEIPVNVVAEWHGSQPQSLTQQAIQTVPGQFAQSDPALADTVVEAEPSLMSDDAISFGAEQTPATVDAPPPPAFDAPAFDAPVADAPAFDAPAFDAPVADAPVFDAPVFDAPVADAPVFDAPAFDAAGEFGVPDGLDDASEAQEISAEDLGIPTFELPSLDPSYMESIDSPLPGDPAPPADEPLPAAVDFPADTAVPADSGVFDPADTPSLAETPFPEPAAVEEVLEPVVPGPIVAPPPVPSAPVAPPEPAPVSKISVPQEHVPAAPATVVTAPAPAPAPEAPASAPAPRPETEVPAPVASMPVDTPPGEVPTPEPELATTPSGLIRRQRKAPLPQAEAEFDRETSARPSKRSPDQVKSMLSRYKSGLERGRTDGES